MKKENKCITSPSSVLSCCIRSALFFSSCLSAVSSELETSCRPFLSPHCENSEVCSRKLWPCLIESVISSIFSVSGSPSLKIIPCIATSSRYSLLASKMLCAILPLSLMRSKSSTDWDALPLVDFLTAFDNFKPSCDFLAPKLSVFFIRLLRICIVWLLALDLFFNWALSVLNNKPSFPGFFSIIFSCGWFTGGVLWACKKLWLFCCVYLWGSLLLDEESWREVFVSLWSEVSLFSPWLTSLIWSRSRVATLSFSGMGCVFCNILPSYFWPKGIRDTGKSLPSLKCSEVEEFCGSVLLLVV